MSLIVGNAVTSANTALLLVSIDPSLQFASGDVIVVNPNSAQAVVRVVISTAQTAASVKPNDFLRQATIPGNYGELELNCSLVGPGENIYIWSDTAGCIARAALIPQAS
jgi:hypothetical protein